MPLGPPARALIERIARSGGADEAPVIWLTETASALSQRRASPGAAAPAFVGAARRMGRAPLAAGEPLAGPDGPVPTDGWSVDEAARAALLCAAAEGSPAELSDLVDEVYREGDSREKRAVVRALPLLPFGERFVELALDAGRTNESDLFTALACGNPYPARHFGENEWNKLVMKAAFVGAPVAAIVGLERRANRELARMALDLVDQQESASRSFPPEVWLLVAPFAGPVGLARMIGYLNHAVPSMRRGAADGLGRARLERARPWLFDRAEIERDPEVRAAIARALDDDLRPGARPGGEVSR